MAEGEEWPYLPYLEATKTLLVGLGRGVDPGRIESAAERLEEMAERAAGGDLRWLGHAVELFLMMLTQFRTGDMAASAFVPYPADAKLKGLEVRKTGEREWLVVWKCERGGRQLEAKYKVESLPGANLLRISPALE
jgi:hypothetical protein